MIRVIRGLKEVYRDSLDFKLHFGGNFIRNGEDLSEIKKLEKFPVFRRRRRSPELEVEDNRIFRQI